MLIPPPKPSLADPPWARVLAESNLGHVLAPFDGVLAGTFPIGLNLPHSDLDILWEFFDQAHFVRVISLALGHMPGWRIKQTVYQTRPSVITAFELGDYRVEVFAQPCPVWFQNAYRHMVVERRLLRLGGEPLRKRILALKKSGASTEEAFAQELGLEGCPYQNLYNLSFLTVEELACRIR